MNVSPLNYNHAVADPYLDHTNPINIPFLLILQEVVMD